LVSHKVGRVLTTPPPYNKYNYVNLLTQAATQWPGLQKTFKFLSHLLKRVKPFAIDYVVASRYAVAGIASKDF
jgi:hypothetical protein